MTTPTEFSWQNQYDVAREIGELAPWEVLGEDDVFAVEDERGELAFVHMHVTEDGKALFIAPDEEAFQEFDVWDLGPSADDEPFDPAPEPYHRSTPKVGRNEPCPRGSGKKYKKCCGR